ncbi:MAG: lipoprotein signal peptidase [Mediterranea sp.]|jgi:signal peptidase II|nr:lipoprotein signal peptidase [Mediterranea sp.]
MKYKKTGAIAILIVLVILILDQSLKIWVKTNMYYGDAIRMTDWFYIHFVENNGMAFGMQIMPKIIQTILRVVFSLMLVEFLTMLVKSKYKIGYIICVSLVLSGALGNIIDSLFYGVAFSKSTISSISEFVPIGQGYAGWLQGKVVDMLYFPLFDFYWPNWIPVIGGDKFVFFSPIFNIADAAISCGIFAAFLFYNRNIGDSIMLFYTTIKERCGLRKRR